MRILQRYVWREISVNSLAVTLVLFAILFVYQIGAVLARAAELRYPRAMVFELFALGALQNVAVLLPFGLLLGTVLALGRLHHMRVQWTYRAKNAANWRAKRELSRWWALAGVGTHALDLVRWWMMPTAGEVSQVRSMIGRSTWGGPNDETAILLLRFESGATAEILASVLFDSPRRVDLYGSEASAHCDGTLGPYGDGNIVLRGEDLRWEIAGPYEGEIVDFTSAILGSHAPEVDGEEALRNIEILEHAVSTERGS